MTPARRAPAKPWTANNNEVLRSLEKNGVPYPRYRTSHEANTHQPAEHFFYASTTAETDVLKVMSRLRGCIGRRGVGGETLCLTIRTRQ
jgi:hypothetical protein